MSENPLVSIIVRTKDRPKLLERAMQSIAEQDYRPIEVILVNDGGCYLDIEKLNGILKDIPLNYVRLEKNRGRAHAGNVGIKDAKGEYIGFLDDDDEFYSNHTSTLISFLEQSDYKVAYTDAKLIHKVYDEQEEKIIDIDQGIFHSKEFSYNKLLTENYIPFMCIIFPRKHLQNVNGFDEELDLYEDWDLLIRVGYDNPFYHIKKATAKYNIWSEHLQITERAKYLGETGSAYSKIFYKHIKKLTPETIQSLLRERDMLNRFMSEKVAVISEKEEAEIERLRREVTEKEAVISEKETVILEGEAIISEKEAAILEKDAVISEKDAVILKEEAEIERLRREVTEKEAEIENLHKGILSKEVVISEKNVEIENLCKDISEKDFILSEIYKSLSWQLLTKYRRVKDRLLPQESKRRMLYDSGLKKFNNVIRNKGFNKLFHKTKTKISAESLNRFWRKVKISTSLRIKPLSRPRNDKAEVSIIIPVFNNAKYTFNCINSISENTKGVEYEIIIVDNASTDQTSKVLKEMKNLTVVTNTENLGFVEACNIGARAASSKYLVFLNNDTEVKEGWLKALVDTAKMDAPVGMVGAKLLYPDGKLQEAGGIVWDDGSAWNYGRGDDPEKPEYNYLREVDYCSAACILVRKDLFEKVNGFDIRYIPAYCEDSDLAFTIRKFGYRVLYQPQSEVIHFEGITAGTDISTGIKKYQEINKKKFTEKWKEVLVNEHMPAGADVFLARERDYKKKRRMLFIDHYVPTYDKDAGSVRMFEYLKIFLEMGFKIVFWPDNLAKMEPYTTELQQMGIEVLYGNRDFDEYIDSFGKYFDVIYLSRAHISIKYINKIKQDTHAKIIYDSHDLAFLREGRRAEIENNVKLMEDVNKIKQREFNLARISDAMIVVSPYERELMLSEDPNLKIYHMPHVHPVGTISVNGFQSRKNIMFIGGFVHPPNEDGVCWFANEILPIIAREIPDIKFYIIGSYPTKKVNSLASDNIIITGYVHDVSNYFETAKVFIAPMRYGAGVKGKIIHSMSYGLPTVTTTIGAEGLGLENDNNAFIADSPEEFAKRVIELYKDGETWNKISKNSFMWMKSNFTPEIAKKKLSKMFQELGILN